MGWKTVRGTRYFYEYVRVKGKTRLMCWGYGREAREAAERVERKKQNRAEQIALVTAWSRADRKIDTLLKAKEQEVWRDVAHHLRLRGYHKVRGHWRKMNEHTLTEAQKNEVELPFLGYQWLQKNGGQIAVNGSGGEVELGPDSPPTENELRVAEIEKLSSMEHTIRMLALNGLRRTGPDRTLQDYDTKQITEELYTNLIELRKKLRHEDASPLEKLVIEQVMTAWVQWYVTGWQVETMPYGDEYMKLNHYLERRYLRCQTRLMRGFEQLTRLRVVPKEYLEEGRTLEVPRRRRRRRKRPAR